MKTQILISAHKMAKGAIRNGKFNGIYRNALSWAMRKAWATAKAASKYSAGLRGECERMIATSEAKPKHSEIFWEMVNIIYKKNEQDEFDAQRVWVTYLEVTDYEAKSIVNF